MRSPITFFAASNAARGTKQPGFAQRTAEGGCPHMDLIKMAGCS
jgi:hypothetical protein